MVYIVGIGPGAKEYILPKAEEIISKCDITIGFERAISSIKYIAKNNLTLNSLSKTLEYINSNKDKNIAIAASGDPCFYGISNYIKLNYSGDIEIIPGISSFQYLMTKLNKTWQGAYLSSLHGRNEDFIDKVKNHKLSIWLTDKNSSPKFICTELLRSNMNATVYVGENLSYEDERIITGNVEDIIKTEFGDLCVVVIEALM